MDSAAAMTRALSLVALLSVTACTADVDPAAPPDDDGGGFSGGKEDSPTDGWTYLGKGVEYRRVNSSNGVLIAYGGYTAKLAYSAAWAEELVDANLGAAGIGQIYAVQGPQDASYAAKEIANTKLRAHLATVDDGDAPIVVVAHSSGSFVAHEMLGQMERAGEQSRLARLDYYDLDGGGSGLTHAIAVDLHKLTFVYARDPSLVVGYSQNHITAVALAGAYAPMATSFQVTVPGSGCGDGAGWCLHDLLVTHRPHDHWSYDLADDYTDFDNRPVTDDYLPAGSDPPPSP